jgi:hypothetical protein
MSSPIALVVAFSGSASAASNEIEGVWSFGGGSVAIQQLSTGRFQGTVVSATTFATCPHPEGEVMWTNMAIQSDGSLWGFHQWYLGTKCEPDPQLGQTAWRVLKNPDGSRYLKVCFSDPSTDSQPTIAADVKGTAAHDTYGCTQSAALAALPETEGSGDPGSSGSGSGSGSGPGSSLITFSQTVILPAAKACISQSSLTIKLKDPKYDPLKEVVVKIGAKKVADVKGVKRLKKGITLKTLPSGTYKISVLATTVLNQHLSGSQSYKSCTKGTAKIKLHGRKPHHHA